MTYTATWENASQGRVVPAEHYVRLSDPAELADAINRRRRLTYLGGQDFSSQVHSLAEVRQATISSQQAPPFDALRLNVIDSILAAPPGGLGGDPPTPQAMTWLWPVDDGDQGKPIVSGASGVPEGKVGLFQKLNGTAGWTNPSLLAGRSAVRAVHFNELRQCVEWLRRGRWEMPIYFAAGIVSSLPDTPWVGELIANNGSQELRSLGFAVLRTGDSPPRGLVNATVRSGSLLEVTADTDCRVELYRCLRALDFVDDPPTWNQYDPSASANWGSPGGTGTGDAVLLGWIDLVAAEPGTLCVPAVTQALQAIVDGAEQNVLVRRSDTGGQTVTVTGRAVIEFELNSPPN
jgi:hypothetical protein